MSIEDRFYAAVNVISGLPKHGPYQPSTEMKLSFYAFYKQATEGPNNDTKPWSWEVTKKAKWDAWKKLGDMTKKEAMGKYVEELNKIVETMSYTENVAHFLKSMDDFNSHEPDKELKIGTELSILDSSTSSNLPPLHCTNDQLPPAKAISLPEKDEDSLEEDGDEFYTDSVDSTLFLENNISDKTVITTNGHVKSDSSFMQEHATDVLMRSVLTLRNELNEITITVHQMEQRLKSLSLRNHLFEGLSIPTIAFIILWPVAVNCILIWLYYRKRVHSRR